MNDSYTNFAEKAVQRFYRNLTNGLEVLLKEKTITEDTTVKDLLIACKEKKIKKEK